MSLVSPADVALRCPAAASHDQTDLQLIIDANEQLMAPYVSGAAGVDGSQTIRITDAYPKTVLLLPERAVSVASVTEHYLWQDPADDLILAADDWFLAPDGTAIVRRYDGTNQRDHFADEVVVVYVGASVEALRKNVLIQLTCLDLSGDSSGTGNVNSQLQSRRLGDYSETFSTGASAQSGGISAEKQAVLDQLSGSRNLPVFA